MKENNICKNIANRRELKAARERNYHKAAYYAADHTLRLGRRAWTIVNALRRPVDLGRPDARWRGE